VTEVVRSGDVARLSEDPFDGPGEARRAARAVDWAATPLGAAATWPATLQAIVRLSMWSPTPIAIWALPELTLVHNEAYLPVLGARAPWAMGRPGREVWSEVWDALAPELERVVRTGEPVRFEDRPYVLRRNGHDELAYFTFTLAPIRDEQGRTLGVFNVCEETTPLHEHVAHLRTEEALRASEERQAFLLSLSDALRPLRDPVEIQHCAARLVGEHLRATRALYAEIVDEHEAVIARDWVDGVPSASGRYPLTIFGSELAALLRAGPLVIADVERDPRLSEESRDAYRALGVAASMARSLVKRGRWVASFSVQSRTPRSWTASELALLEEVAERTWAAVDRARAESAVREADQRKSEFLAVLSHELRNPLAPIRSSLYLLDRAAPGSELAARARAVLDRQTRHLARLVDDLLDVTRITRGKVELFRSRLDLRDVVRKTTDDLRSTFEERGVALRIEPAGEAAWVNGDGVRLAQALANLLQNAAKFTPAGGTVTVSLAVAGGKATVSIRDTGEGMEPDVVERMFEPFEQAAQGLARTRGGLGLGLALVKGFVELHGGTVHAASRGLGAGAEFTIDLPLAEPAPALAGRPGAAPVPATARDVLVVEDSVDQGRTLADVLRLLGHRARLALDGGSGLALARERRPDVVLCDIGLPDMSGYEVARTLRMDPALAGIQLVALTGYAQPEDRQRALDAGFDVHLPKPPSLEQLEELLRAPAAPRG
jgi:signal transduction histidine kinase